MEAIEMAVRSAMHHAGATALTELLQFAVPDTDQRSLPCSCGQQACYRALRSKPVLTAVGQVNISRPYYLCQHCHIGQFPADVELDIDPPADADPLADVETFKAEVSAVKEAVRDRPLDGTFVSRRGQTISLRWVYVHMIEEYARHNGHADLIRQAIDGAVGE